MICLIISAPLSLVAAENSAKAGSVPAVPAKAPILITIQGLRDEDSARSCLNAINRYRKRALAFAEKGDGDYQIVIEKKRPGYQVRVEKQGAALKTGRALYDYEICIAAAAMAREAISDD